MFTEADAEGAPPVAVVDESFAQRFYPNEDPVGKRIKRGKLDSTRPWMTIVGVVRHVKSRRLDSSSGAQVYFPFYQDPTAYNMSLVVRTSAVDPLSLTGRCARRFNRLITISPSLTSLHYGRSSAIQWRSAAFPCC